MHWTRTLWPPEGALHLHRIYFRPSACCGRSNRRRRIYQPIRQRPSSREKLSQCKHTPRLKIRWQRRSNLSNLCVRHPLGDAGVSAARCEWSRGIVYRRRVPRCTRYIVRHSPRHKHLYKSHYARLPNQLKRCLSGQPDPFYGHKHMSRLFVLLLSRGTTTYISDSRTTRSFIL